MGGERGEGGEGAGGRGVGEGRQTDWDVPVLESRPTGLG